LLSDCSSPALPCADHRVAISIAASSRGNSITRSVSVIIPTHNRFERLLAAVASVQNQTHGDVELIVVNDGSSDPAYGSGRPEGVTWLDLPVPTVVSCGRPCPGHVRNAGLARAAGDFVAFLDDDDAWAPTKLYKQLDAMAASGQRMSCTEALMGDGPMVPGKRYPIYHREFFRTVCVEHYRKAGRRWPGRLPEVFTRDFILGHNFIITSSVVLERDLLHETGGFNCLPRGEEDEDLWLRCLERTDCLHLNEPLVYYDGRGQARPKRDALHRRIVNRVRAAR
jgi:glycosyltransferase involved in cell wall biosynthesis